MAKYINKDTVYEIFPERLEDINKGSFGRILNIAGAKSYVGAAYLSSLSALKIGAGFLTLACPEEIVNPIATLAPEIPFIPLKSSSFSEIEDEFNKSDIISLGCGLSTKDNVKNFVFDILKNKKDNQKFVVDADGINIMAQADFEISLKNSVITPHPKELSRLLKVDMEEILDNKEKYSRIAAKKYDCITVLKGHETIITDGDEIYINKTKTSALAKAGSGDVLTGIISGMAAQGASLLESAISGVFIHGLAGDIAAEDLSAYCVLASDIIDYLPFCINEILSDE